MTREQMLAWLTLEGWNFVTNAKCPGFNKGEARIYVLDASAHYRKLGACESTEFGSPDYVTNEDLKLIFKKIQYMRIQGEQK